LGGGVEGEVGETRVGEEWDRSPPFYEKEKLGAVWLPSEILTKGTAKYV